MPSVSRPAARYPFIVTAVYAACAAAAFAVGLAGWRDDPLAWVFAIVLAQPWLVLLGPLVDAALERAGEFAGVIFILVGFVINGCLIYAVLRWISLRGRGRDGFRER